ncbi:MAG: tRNA lysidine(34) synthetase TilS [Nitrospirae bacterium]|nr:tRNA lysidine(34) synthetase TilS [Candidatus Manganitrophaceae bacterium]
MKPSLLLEKFAQAIRRFGLAPQDKVLVAVSGGPDSVCLLHLLKNLPSPFSLSLHVAHLNHQFRAEAKDEAFFVERLAKNWGLPVTLSAQPVAQICKENGLSRQAGARQVRYAFFEKTAKKTACQWIALGHTADDQAETFLMRMLRGSGVSGLSGIPEQRDGGFIRPLMNCSRSEIMQELSRADLAFCNDPSNQQKVYLRNKIRHDLLPILESYNPKIKEALHREATLLGAEDDLIHQSMLAQLPRLDAQVTAEAVSFCVASLQGLHLALQRRVLRWGIEQLQGHLNGIAFKHIEAALLHVLSGKDGSIYQLPQGLNVQKNGLKFCIFRGLIEEGKNEFHLQESECALPKWEEAPFSVTRDFPSWNLRFLISSSSKQDDSFSACKASFDFDKISGPLFIRGWRQGDRFAPLGMGGRHKKLQDFFIDAKIKRVDRHRIPVLSSREGILWVIGHRIDARFCATDRSLRVLTIAVQECV